MLFFVLSILISTLVTPSNAFPSKQKNAKIIGGIPINIEDYPHQISLQYYGSHICGGSIISEKWIITAAHCTSGTFPSDLTIRTGVTNLQTEKGQTIKVSRIHEHPDFSKITLDFDISLLELSESIIFCTKSQPISLPKAGSEDPSMDTNVICTGWGETKEEGGTENETLQAVTLQIVQRAKCNEQYDGMVTENMICAGYGEKGACAGDSGGPLVEGDQLVGIISWSYGCARPDYPGVFTNIVGLREFIRKQTGI